MWHDETLKFIKNLCNETIKMKYFDIITICLRWNYFQRRKSNPPSAVLSVVLGAPAPLLEEKWIGKSLKTGVSPTFCTETALVFVFVFVFFLVFAFVFVFFLVFAFVFVFFLVFAFVYITLTWILLKSLKFTGKSYDKLLLTLWMCNDLCVIRTISRKPLFTADNVCPFTGRVYFSFLHHSLYEL